jgi:catechol 2,3-dioxygenase-like lactoylglutathione lyase family enzyme
MRSRIEINGVAETAIYVADVARSADFYQDIFGFEKLIQDEDFCSFAVPGNAVFLIFRKDSRPEPYATAGGIIPPHDGSGRMHFAFKVSKDSLAHCETELTARGIAIESRVDWPPGGVSLYFRDPDEHLVELITPGVWKVY